MPGCADYHLLFSGGVFGGGGRPCVQRIVARVGELDQQAPFEALNVAYMLPTLSRGDRWKRLACSAE